MINQGISPFPAGFLQSFPLPTSINPVAGLLPSGVKDNRKLNIKEIQRQ